MELVFVHGWGFDARFWDALCAHLKQFKHRLIDLGFFSDEPAKWKFPASHKRILIGHSLGFVHAMRQRQDWGGWVAINSFSCFVQTPERPGCVPLSNLREMRMKLQADHLHTLEDFYRMLEAEPPTGTPHLEHLHDGLDELRDGDIGDILKSLAVPGLALAGRLDPLVPVATSEALGELARGGGLLMHDKGGHLLPQTQAAWCAKAISDFLDTHCG